jgi:hypothetical protein
MAMMEWQPHEINLCSEQERVVLTQNGDRVRNILLLPDDLAMDRPVQPLPFPPYRSKSAPS